MVNWIEKSTFMDQTKGSVWSSMWAPKFDMKNLKAAEGLID